MPPDMNDADDLYLLCFDVVEDFVREPADQRAPHVLIDDRVAQRILCNLFED